MNAVPTTSGAAGTAPAAPRFVDRGAVFAGWVGLGMALVIVISFELIVAVQSVVFVIAPLSGLLIGMYANMRSERYRPVSRVLANAAWAGLVTGFGLALVYAFVRLLFVFADSGYRPVGQGGQIDCQNGPECTFVRYLDEGRGADLAAAGVTDGASFGRLVVSEHINGALVITLLTLGGALAAGGIRAVSAPPAGAVAGAAAEERHRAGGPEGTGRHGP